MRSSAKEFVPHQSFVHTSTEFDMANYISTLTETDLHELVGKSPCLLAEYVFSHMSIDAYLQLDDQLVDDVRKSESNSVFCRHQELGCGKHIGRRKILGEAQLLGTLLELPLTSEIGYISKEVTRRCLRECEKEDGLPELPSADFSNTVVLTNEDSDAVSASCRGPPAWPCAVQPLLRPRWKIWSASTLPEKVLRNTWKVGPYTVL